MSDITYVDTEGKTRVMPEDPQAVEEFGFHPASDASRPLHQEAREHFIWLASWIKANVPAGRLQAMAYTKLQESLWATNAGIAINLAPLSRGE